MGGCGTKDNFGGNYDAGEDRVLGWVAGGASVVGAAGLLSVMEVGWVGGWGALLGLAVVAVAAGAGAILGFFIGFAVNWFDRLHAQDPPEITIAGCVLCAGKNTGYPPFNDNDWTFNIGGKPDPPVQTFSVLGPAGAGLTLDEVRTRGAPGGGPAFKTFQKVNDTSVIDMLHCEIGSRIGDYAAIGAAIGSVAGAIGGALAGAAICAAIGLATFGIGALVCLLIVAAMIAAGAFVGGVVGNTIGAGIGAIADWITDLDERGEAISQGCLMTITGSWVTDSSHQHNEIHDIKRCQLIDCCTTVDCSGCAKGTTASGLIAAVGTGRHPTGRDP